jgi:Spy/CpxP family protein refolding chaperone
MNAFKMIVCLVFVLIAIPAFAQTEFEFQYQEALKKTQPRSVSPLTSLQATVKGTFWRNPEWVKLLDLSADQQKKMDEIFQQYRLKLVDLTASLQKEELILEPLLGGSRPAPEAEAKILAQIDRIAESRAELEKANSKMLVAILQVLTPEQWSKLPTQQKKAPPFFFKTGK